LRPESPYGLEFLKLKHIKTLVKFFKKEWSLRSQEIFDDMNSGVPLEAIY